MLLETQYWRIFIISLKWLYQNNCTKLIKKKKWRKMLNLIHQIVFNENKVKKKVPVHIILKKQSTLLKKFLAWIIILNFLTILFFENLTMQLQSYENPPSHIQCKECLWFIKNTSSLSLLTDCNWFFTKNRLPIIIINWMEITLLIKAEKER